MSSRSKKRKIGVAKPLDSFPCDGIRKDNPRLQRHLRHFQNSEKDLCNIIRLKLVKNRLDRKALERHATHVAAWVALLPGEAALVISGVSGLSPVTLLSRLLARRGKGPMTEWLRGVLGLVRERIDKEGLKCEDWLQLKQSLPRSTKRRDFKLRFGLVEESSILPSRTGSDESTLGAVGSGAALKAFAESRAVWDNMLCLSDQDSYIDSLKDSLEGCLAVNDSIGVKRVACKLAAALMPPRALSRSESQDARSLDVVAQDKLQRAHQTKLRNLMLTCLSHVDLTDEECQPAVQHILELMEHFIDRCGTLENARASKQWISLKAILHRSVAAKSSIEYRENVPFEYDNVAKTRAREDSSQNWSASGPKYTVIGLGVEWSTELDIQMMELVNDGVGWESMEKQLHRSARWLKMRHRQLEKDPAAPCPTGNRDSSSAVRVGHRNLARLALERMSNRIGTVKEICAEILKLDLPEIDSLDRNIMPGPTRTSNEERWMARVADEVSKCPEFVMIGKRGLQGLWQLRLVS